jgi:uncharacterized protein (TIGR00156 family)
MRRPLLAILALTAPSLLLAQGEHPPATHEGHDSATHPHAAAPARIWTVKEILAAPRDDEDVVLRGRIVRHLRGDHYLFSDETGEIEIEIDDDYPRDRITFNEDVEIHGEVDLDRNRKPEIEVDAIVTRPGRIR